MINIWYHMLWIGGGAEILRLQYVRLRSEALCVNNTLRVHLFSCRASNRLVSITNDTNWLAVEEVQNPHKIVRDGLKFEPPPIAKMHFLMWKAKLFFLISLWTLVQGRPMPRIWKGRKSFDSESSPLERRHKPMIALVHLRWPAEIGRI